MQREKREQVAKVAKLEAEDAGTRSRAMEGLSDKPRAKQMELNEQMKGLREDGKHQHKAASR